jgi:hypothetical protein
MSRFSPGVWRLAAASLALAVLMVAAGCGSSPQTPGATSTQVPTAGDRPPSSGGPDRTLSLPTRTPSVTTVPTVSGPSSVDLMSICADGPAQPASGAGPYTKGRNHPVVVVDAGTPTTQPTLAMTYDINARFLNRTWTTPLELVICVAPDKVKSAGSCGLYKRASDGKIGTVVKYRHSVALTVFVASTGKRLQVKVLYGPVPNCDQTESVSSGNPPWGIYGSLVSSDSINTYALAVARQLN